VSPRFTHRLPLLAFFAVSASFVPGLGPASGPVAGTAASAKAPGLAAAQSAAAQFPIDGPLMRTAQRVASEHWGGTPCAGTVSLEWKPLGASTNAAATWFNPTDVWSNPAANYDCAIELNAGADFAFPELCTILAHEIGHLMGHPHADHGGDLMSPTYTTPLAACTAAAPAPVAKAKAKAKAKAESSTRSSDRRSAKRARVAWCRRAIAHNQKSRAGKRTSRRPTARRLSHRRSRC